MRTFECYFERHKFDSIINSGEFFQKLSSESFILKTLTHSAQEYFEKLPIKTPKKTTLNGYISNTKFFKTTFFARSTHVDTQEGALPPTTLK